MAGFRLGPDFTAMALHDAAHRGQPDSGAGEVLHAVQPLEQAEQAKRRGLTPTIVVLTDGRANIALDGKADRPQAGADAERVAKTVRAAGVDCLVIDTGNRPEQALSRLAALTGGTYLPMPRADAARLSAGVSAALGD